MTSLDSQEVLELKESYKQKVSCAIARQHKNLQDGIATALDLSNALDEFILSIIAKVKLKNNIIVLAVGSFGRQELSLYSDVDLWFLAEENAQEEIKKLLYPLWDMGFRIGYSVGNEAETLSSAKEDMTVRTTLIDARLIYGEHSSFSNFKDKFKVLLDEDFINAKIKEQDIRHKNMGLSRYVLEPDLKQSFGALRDINFIEWIAKIAFSCASPKELSEKAGFSEHDIMRFYAAKNFLLTARIYLHEIAGRGDNILAFAYQKEVASSMGYSSRKGQEKTDRLMKHFYLIARWVHYLNIGLLARLDKSKKIASPVIFSESIDVLRFLQNPKTWKYLDDYQTLKQIAFMANGATKLKNNREAFCLLGNIITAQENSEKVLQVLNESGFLPRMWTAFNMINAKAQRDVYHIYTIDEHSLKTLGFIHKCQEGGVGMLPLGIASLVADYRKLYWAAILHDIGKDGTLGHAERGAEYADNILDSFGVEKENKDDVCWLIRNHLIMSKIAFHRDLSDEKTVADFAKVVGSKQRLLMLFLLTAADIMAVAPNVWNEWKCSLLVDLYEKTCKLIDGKQLGLKTNIMPLMNKMEKLAGKNSFAILSEPLLKEKATRLVVYAPDKEGLFADIVGAITLSGASTQSARIRTINGFAIDVFLIQDTPSRYKPEKKTGGITDQDKLNRLKKNLEAVLNGELMPEKTLDARKVIRNISNNAVASNEGEAIGNVKELLARVIIDNNASENCTIVDINAKDGKGFLFVIASLFKKLSLDIVSAHIGTYGLKVVDSFYVTKKGGGKITAKEEVEKLKQELYKVLETYF